MGLFNDKGLREFKAVNSRGEKIAVEYEIDTFNGDVIIHSVGGLSVQDYPLPAQYRFVVLHWIDEHRASLGAHTGFNDGCVPITGNTMAAMLGACSNQNLDVSNTIAA